MIKSLRKNIALFWGNFNPVHNGHINVVKNALGCEQIDEVWIIPRRNNLDKNLISSKYRVEMLGLVFETYEKVYISKEGLGSKNEVSAYDIVKRLKEKYSSYNFYWIFGSDVFSEFDKIENFDLLLKEIEFIIFSREGFPILNNSKIKPFLILREGKNNITSSKIRENSLNLEFLEENVPFMIRHYILTRSLYC